MTRLPVIVGFGGINPAGRISFHHAYRRLIVEALGKDDQARTYRSLASLMNISDDADSQETRAYIEAHTLIRKIELFDPDNVPVQRAAKLAHPDDQPIQFLLAKRQLPAKIPPGWQVTALNSRQVQVSVASKIDVMLPDTQVSRVGSAGQVPTGFDPGALYQSRNHPRGLQLTVFGASDALRSTGISLEELKRQVAPDQFAVYSGSAMGQLDNEGFGGMLQNPLLGKRPTSKNVALGLCEMPGDFINAYVMGSVGDTAGIIGACATFLYNVKHGSDEIRSGRKRVVVVGNAEAPVVPEVIEAYRVMGALAEDEALMALDGSEGEPDYRRACRPFSDNCGFTVAEASVYAVLMDDELAMELGARVLGCVGGVYVSADGYKKSISGPGIGNYVTVAKAMSVARAMLGEKSLRQRTHMLAHGTGTPQNRVTESQVLNELAKIYGIERWPVGAIKAYVGHSMAPAGGDQLAVALGMWEHGWMPGITTIDHIADDVHDSHLQLPIDHLELGVENIDGAFVNSKGFGGNNATGFFVSPARTREMLNKRWGNKAMAGYLARNEAVEQAALSYDEAMDRGEVKPIYQFGQGVLHREDLKISRKQIEIPGFAVPVNLELENPYPDMF
ncbi:MAG: beta-ketoacyl synthase [Gammaproteobacteria bacterium]|nr:beta-ketoacyl synthase [Gammaproteobacteria bacterium]